MRRRCLSSIARHAWSSCAPLVVAACRAILQECSLLYHASCFGQLTLILAFVGTWFHAILLRACLRGSSFFVFAFHCLWLVKGTHQVHSCATRVLLAFCYGRSVRGPTEIRLRFTHATQRRPAGSGTRARRFIACGEPFRVVYVNAWFLLR